MVAAENVPVFYPTMEDMQGNMEDYIEKVEDQFAHIGICKIVPPKEWCPRAEGYDGVDFYAPKPIRQHATGRQGIFRSLLIENKGMSILHDLKPLAESPDCQPRSALDNYAALEREFWKHVTYTPPLYCADVEGSLFDENVKGWNIRYLDTILSRTLQAHNVAIPGVNTPYLYFGTWRSTFAWHTEDIDLYSVNYLHYGRSKSWFCIAPEHRKRFECVVEGLMPDLFRKCPEFLRHKEILVSPSLLQKHNIPVHRVIQHEREFVINFPGAYHAGFNIGFNCAESTNFGTRRWVDIGRQARYCKCSGDSVRIDMSIFDNKPSVSAARAPDTLQTCETCLPESHAKPEQHSAAKQVPSTRDKTSQSGRKRKISTGISEEVPPSDQCFAQSAGAASPLPPQGVSSATSPQSSSRSRQRKPLPADPPPISRTAAKSRETTSSTPPAKTKGRKSASAAIPLDIVATTTVADLRAVDVVIKANKIIVKKKKTKVLSVNSLVEESEPPSSKHTRKEPSIASSVHGSSAAVVSGGDRASAQTAVTAIAEPASDPPGSVPDAPGAPDDALGPTLRSSRGRVLRSRNMLAYYGDCVFK
ncbi:hypothetical protein CYMTET_11049 [Cymbomonas tetramitiformis]|uniref:Uncharacterized protein n=1 Tax=Cymbomonas tetramitiformis TaxID=36881 RepID=A0AAE0LDU9_9CHLO|nr:hypothetical protein CYMTET_11049 [Cymbomonas tetramitiformis]